MATTHPTRTAHPYVLRDGEGEQLRGPVGGPVRIMARAETTGGTFAALHNVVAPGMGPPLHLHVREDEMFYVLEGRLHVRAGEHDLDAPAGSFVFVPRGTPHAFRNPDEVPARILVMFTPAGMERFFEGQAALPAGPADPQAYRRVAHSAWMEVLGPPLTADDRVAG